MATGVEPSLFTDLGIRHSILRLPVPALVSEGVLNIRLTDDQIVRIHSLSPILIRPASRSRALSEYGFRMLCPDNLISANIPVECPDLTSFHRQFKPLFTLLE